MHSSDQLVEPAASLTLTIPQAARLLGISVSKAYEAARSGELPALRVGTRVPVSRRRLLALVDGTPATSEPTPPMRGRVGNRTDALGEPDPWNDLVPWRAAEGRGSKV
jgi:excisionase family DNA binding protein